MFSKVCVSQFSEMVVQIRNVYRWEFLSQVTTVVYNNIINYNLTYFFLMVHDTKYYNYNYKN